MMVSALRSLVMALMLAAAALAAADEAVQPTLEEILALDAWTESRFAKFADGTPLSLDETLEATRLAMRLDRLGSRWLQGTSETPTLSAKIDNADLLRGKLVRFAGRLKAATRKQLPPTDATRLEVDSLFELQVKLDDGSDVLVEALRVPRAWQLLETLDEPVRGGAMLLKLSEQNTPIVALPEVAWYPQQPRYPAINFGHTVLSTLGFNVAELDTVVQRERLLPEESAAFYALLAAVGDVGPSQLVRFAERNTQRFAEATSERLSESAPLVGRAVLAAGDEGRYSVVPFFNEAEQQVGELVTFDGLVRRCVRIELSGGSTGAVDPVASEFAVDHYYELQLFPADAQNNPVVFCVRQLPSGFPTGENLREDVRIAGFFLKSWRYASRNVTDEGQAVLRVAPLFIGSGPLRLVAPQPTFPWGIVAATTFVAGLAITWWYVWQQSRGDRAFERRLRSLRSEAALADIEPPTTNQ